MHEHSFAENAYLMLLTLPLIVPLGLALAVDGRSYLREASAGRWVFRPPLAGIVCCVTLPVWLYVVMRFTLVDRAATVSFLRGVPTHPQTQQMLLVNGLVIAGIYGAALLWFKAQWFLALDLRQRTWRSLDISRMPFREKTGPWNEIMGIEVVTRPKSGYRVQLCCSYPSTLYCTLGKFGTSSEATQFADRTAQELGLLFFPAKMLIQNR